MLVLPGLQWRPWVALAWGRRPQLPSLAAGRKKQRLHTKTMRACTRARLTAGPDAVRLQQPSGHAAQVAALHVPAPGAHPVRLHQPAAPAWSVRLCNGLHTHMVVAARLLHARVLRHCFEAATRLQAPHRRLKAKRCVCHVPAPLLSGPLGLEARACVPHWRAQEPFQTPGHALLLKWLCLCLGKLCQDAPEVGCAGGRARACAHVRVHVHVLHAQPSREL